MSALISVLRQAIQRSGDDGAGSRQRIYDSARRAIENMAARANPPSSPEVLLDQLKKLDIAVAALEKEFAPESIRQTN